MDTPEPSTTRHGAPDPARLAGRAWHALAPSEALAALDASDDGLTSAEVLARRAAFGANLLPRAKRPGPLLVYLRQFKNPLVYLLLAATVVSLFVGEFTDAGFIFVVLQLNAVIGGYQEWRAESAAEALDKLIRNLVVVRRDGRRLEVEASELVPGDLVQLESGSRVPADLRLLEARELTVDESLLTGESTSVGKSPDEILPPPTPLAERDNMLYAGTTVLAGRATGVVTGTAGRTEIGHIAQALLAGGGEPPPLVRRLEQFSRRIGVATMVLIGVIALAQFAQGLPLVTVFLVAVALAVAAIPEGLPVAITVALAIATNRMALRNVIVRALPAVEGLGACTLIASDKTGTLTCNELTVKRVQVYGAGQPIGSALIGGEGYAADGAITAEEGALDPARRAALLRLAESGILCNEASIRFTDAGPEGFGDTVDVAFLVLGAKLGLDGDTLRARAPTVGIVPYEPHRRYAAVLVAATAAPGDSRLAAHVKGAAEVVLPMCADIDRAAAGAVADTLAAEGYRVLAVARGPVARDNWPPATPESLRGLEFLGFVCLIDPVRPEVPEAVRRCGRAGIAVRMITGDHPETALAIARTLGIAETAEQVVGGRALTEADGDQARFDQLVAGARVFARVEPVQKLSIVQSLQRQGHLVAVTGDGVNDAPALGIANLGVAMGRSGTDVARGAADLILADDNFASIVAGVEEGRVAYDNVRKLIYLLITTGLGEIVLFLLAIVAGHPLPLFAVQLLWLNLVTNGIQHVALAFERGEPGVLDRTPRPPSQGLFDRRMIVQVLAAGCYMGAAAFWFFDWCLARGMDEASARNLVLLLMVLFENVHVLNARSERRSALRVPLGANPFVILAIIGAQALHISALYLPGLSAVLGTQPVGLGDWILVAGLAVSLLLVVEVQKLLYGRFLGRR